MKILRNEPIFKQGGQAATYPDLVDLTFKSNIGYREVCAYSLAPEDNHPLVCGVRRAAFPSSYNFKRTSGRYYLEADKKYYLSTVNDNKVKFYNSLYLIAFDSKARAYYDYDCECWTPTDCLILTSGDSRTGIASFAYRYADYSQTTVTTPQFLDTSIALEVGCDSTGPYVKAASKLVVGPSSSSNYASCLTILVNGTHYFLYAELGGTLVNNNKSAIKYNSSDLSGNVFTTSEVSSTGIDDISTGRALAASEPDDTGIEYGSLWLRTVLNENGAWHPLSPCFFRCYTDSSYWCILGNNGFQAPLPAITYFKI